MNTVEPASRRARVLQLSYACGPGRGSEPGIGWHRALEAAKSFDVWVLCEGHEFAESIRRYLDADGPIRGLHFTFVYKRGYERRLERIPGLYQFIYRLWQRRALHAARRLHAEVGFDLVHQVNIASFRSPGLFWQLDAPFVWGPVGGTQNYPWRFLGEAGLRGALGEMLRSTANDLQLRHSSRVRAAARRAARVLASSSINRRRLADALGIDSQLLCDVGIEEIAGEPKDFEEPRAIKILWCGEFSPRKALSLLIKALARLPGGVPYQLRVIGDGRLRGRWQRLARRSGVAEHTEWLGWLPRNDTLSQYRWADVFVFSSLRDTTGTVILEALAAGLPVVCLDHQGAHDVVTDECGIKVPVTTPKQVINALRDAIATLAGQPEVRRRMSVAAVERAQQYLWSRNGEALTQVYRDVLATSPLLHSRPPGADY